MNRAIAVEVAIAVSAAQMDALDRILGPTDPNLIPCGFALLPVTALFALRGLGELVARHLGAANRTRKASA
ncbi:hypothetical protein OG974_04835 [Streptomyces sp. NBC_00597]|uniref:hypothetical protein n=1 Tax=Streptomyces sp. NBC_00597 TaxID=2975786 RepID=UPI0030E28C5F